MHWTKEHFQWVLLFSSSGIDKIYLVLFSSKRIMGWIFCLEAFAQQICRRWARGADFAPGYRSRSQRWKLSPNSSTCCLVKEEPKQCFPEQTQPVSLCSDLGASSFYWKQRHFQNVFREHLSDSVHLRDPIVQCLVCACLVQERKSKEHLIHSSFSCHGCRRCGAQALPSLLPLSLRKPAELQLWILVGACCQSYLTHQGISSFCGEHLFSCQIAETAYLRLRQ